MRILLMFSVSMCMGALGVLVLDVPVWVVALMSLAAVLVIFLSRKRKFALRVLSCGLGFVFGLIWSCGYQALLVQPAVKLAGTLCEISGEAISYSESTDYGVSLRAKITAGGETFRGIVYLDTAEELSPGDGFSLKAFLKSSAEDGNYYYSADGYHMIAVGKTEPVIYPAERVPLKYLPQKIARRLGESLKDAVPDGTEGYALGLVLGDRSLLSATAAEDLKHAGIYHTMALSGLHMGTLAGLVSLLIRNKKLRALVCIPVCVLFTVVTGAPASLVRALIMEILLLIAPLFDRETDTPTSLGFAAMLMVVQNPWCMLGWGTQLSFASVAGIALLSQRIRQGLYGFVRRKRFGKTLRRVIYFVGGSLLTTLSATVFSLPLVMIYFGYISLVAPVTNLLTGFAITWAFRLGLIASVVGVILPDMGGLFGGLLDLLFRYIRGAAGFMAGIPFGVIYTETAYAMAWVLACYVIGAMLYLVGKKCCLFLPCCCVVGGLAVCLSFTMLDGGGTNIAVLDVGQGQCVVAQWDGQTVMIDCGSSTTERSGILAAEYLSGTGNTDVEVLILTHYDRDHVNGVADLLELCDVELLLMPENDKEKAADIITAAENNGTEVRLLSHDTTIRLQGGVVETYVSGDNADANESGLAAYLNVGGVKLLATGDMGLLGEKYLTYHNSLADVDILIAGHHGAADSTSKGLLSAVKPEIVAVSVGNNNYGHPDGETLERILSAGAKIYRTDLHGTIEIRGA